jgi:hypothetical protein
MKHLFKALADFQQEVPVIHKGTQGYGYSYADLPTIFDVINPLLKKNGLGFTQLIEGASIKTILFHVESGETIESITAIPQNVSLKGMNEFQVLGSAITYIRRYALSSALGLVTDKDTDAGGQQVKKETKQADPTSLYPELKRLFQEKADKIEADHFPAIEKTINDKIASNYSKVLNHLKSL